METVQTKEIWKEIKGHPHYFVSNLGRVYMEDRPVWCKKNNSYSIKKGHFCKPYYTNSKHYARIGMMVNNKQKQYQLHRLVAVAFIPNPENKPQVNHIDGDKTNNAVSNLEWVTNLENMQKSWETGLRESMRVKMSAKAPARKLSDEDVLYIREEFNKIGTVYSGRKDFYKKMADKFGLKSISTVCWIFNPKNPTHKYLSSRYSPDHKTEMCSESYSGKENDEEHESGYLYSRN